LIKPIAEAGLEEAAQDIRDERRELIKEQGLSVEMTEMGNLRDC
jgi:hypothetical protein